jgi:UDP-N-acetylglucosamine--N-acetylmuramyl-(pentapeptide) pyrophosphoryl-undecaprenol N-acetylglucosamine transferase
VFPALAVAEYLRAQGEAIVWMGTRSGIESRLVPEAGFPIEWLRVQGIRGKGLLVKALAPLRLVQASWQALTILRHHRPRAVLGMGGFAAGPGGIMARLLRIPLIIHEQNAVIGLTNRILSRFANICFFAFPQAAALVKDSRVVGNPVRQEIVAIEHPSTRIRTGTDRPLKLLVIGGSLGARTLNQVLPEAVSLMEPGMRPQIRHQCGKQHLDACREQYHRAGVEAEVNDFIDNMAEAYAWADLVVCRAGALTVAELATAGVASILVPYPYAVDDHQYANAAFLSDAGAGIVVRDQQLTAPWLHQHLQELSADRKRLQQMAITARSVAYTDAAEQVAKGVLAEALS